MSSFPRRALVSPPFVWGVLSISGTLLIRTPVNGTLSLEVLPSCFLHVTHHGPEGWLVGFAWTFPHSCGLPGFPWSPSDPLGLASRTLIQAFHFTWWIWVDNLYERCPIHTCWTKVNHEYSVFIEFCHSSYLNEKYIINTLTVKIYLQLYFLTFLLYLSCHGMQFKKFWSWYEATYTWLTFLRNIHWCQDKYQRERQRHQILFSSFFFFFFLSARRREIWGKNCSKHLFKAGSLEHFLLDVMLFMKPLRFSLFPLDF